MPPKPTLVILDADTTNPGDLDWSELAACVELTVYARSAPEEVIARAAEAEIVMVNKVLLPQEVLDQLPRLKLVCLMSTGVNVVDTRACAVRGIPVCNVPAYSTASVSELVLALALAWARRVESHAEGVREGDWSASADFSYHRTPQLELAGRTLGIVGFGAIGQGVASWGKALGMQVLAHTRNPETKPVGLAEFVNMAEVFSEADILTLHCPLTDETEHLVDAGRLAMMKNDAFLINTGRGGLVDEAALHDALVRGEIGGAGLDVLSAEPPPVDHPLTQLDNCWVLPHIGWATREARQRLIRVLVANVEGWRNGSPQNVVNDVGVGA